MKFAQFITIFLILGLALSDNPWDTRTDITDFMQDLIREENPEVYDSGYIQISEMFPDNQTGLYYEFVTKKECDDIKTLTAKCGPLIIFIQGGPGYASSQANWQNIGPITIQNGKVSYQQYSWNNFASLLFIDQPIGTGLSHIENSKTTATSIEDAANAMVFFMRKFYKRYPGANQMPVVFFGEGYAAHYISKFMEFFLDDDLLQDIEYIGIGTFGAWYHPVDNGNYYGNYLYSAGLISDATRKKFNQQQTQMVQQLYKGNNSAVAPMMKYLNDYSKNIIKIGDYNYEKPNDQLDYSYIDFLNKNKGKLGIPASASYVKFNQQLANDLVDDCGQSFLERLNELMAEDQEVNFLFINGQLDVAFNNPGVEALINDLSWSDLPLFRKAEKVKIQQTIKGDQITVATVKTYDELSVATVYNAGHLAYNDKPDVVYEIVKQYIERITQ